MIKDITIQERAAAIAYVNSDDLNRYDLFIIAEGAERYNKLTDKSKKTIVNNWFNSHKIQELIKYYQDQKTQKENNIIATVRPAADGDGENEATKTPTNPGHLEPVNFLNLDEFLKYANIQANSIKDEKERRNWVELIGKYMNFKDKDEAESTEIKRYYIMKTCENCEIYNKCKSCTLSECPKA